MNQRPGSSVAPPGSILRAQQATAESVLSDELVIGQIRNKSPVVGRILSHGKRITIKLQAKEEGDS